MFLSEVQAEGSTATKAIIPFGDSITDGYRSTENANRRWPEILANRLGGKIGRIVGGNQRPQVLTWHPVFGDAALSRLDRDVLSVPGAAWIIVLEGVNDLGAQPNIRPGRGRAYRRAIGSPIDRADSLAADVYGASHPTLWRRGLLLGRRRRATRQAVNAWMRSKDSASFDGLVDFDKAMADPRSRKDDGRCDPARCRSNVALLSR